MTRQFGIYAGPIGGEQHGCEMTACGMPTHLDACRIDAELVGIEVEPSNGIADLLDDIAQFDGRAERIVDDGHRDTAGNEGFGDKAELGLVARAPIAAMDEDMERRQAAFGIACRKKVEGVGGAITIALIELASEPFSGSAAALRPLGDIIIESRDGVANIEELFGTLIIRHGVLTPSCS